MLPEKLYQSNTLIQPAEPSIIEKTIHRGVTFLAIIGSLVTASVGLLGISDIAESDEVAYVFAVTIGCIYMAQDGASLLNKADSIVASIKHLNKEVLQRNRIPLTRELIKITVTAILFLIIILSKPLIKALGFYDDIIPVKILLLTISLYLPISVIVDLIPENRLLKKNIVTVRALTDEEDPLLSREAMIVFSYDRLAAAVRTLVSIQEQLRKNAVNDAGIKAQLATVLGCDINLLCSVVDKVKLSKASYYLQGALTFYNLLGEPEKGLKKLGKACRILFKVNTVGYSGPQKLSCNLIDVVNSRYIETLRSHYAYGSDFWSHNAEEQKKSKKTAKLAELSQIERVIMQGPSY